MIKFALQRVGDGGLRISLTGGRTGTTFAFDNASAGTAAWAAVLLFDKLHEGISERIRAIRGDAYERGWRDAKAKNPKLEHFSGCIDRKLNGEEFP